MEMGEDKTGNDAKLRLKGKGVEDEEAGDNVIDRASLLSLATAVEAIPKPLNPTVEDVANLTSLMECRSRKPWPPSSQRPYQKNPLR